MGPGYGVGERTATVTLPTGPAAPGAARAEVSRLLISWGLTDPDWLGQVSVVVSELISNCVRHGGGCRGLTVQARGGDVTLTASDGSATLPRQRPHGGPDGGRGLWIIDEFTDAWGARLTPGGKQVWVRLRAHPDQL
ncbi:ATP-binding protein [Catellatospora methionotrophica]|uniref:ATP-binding protein n=1 Tax=Catellatospora methionotrophica TaxID=121620 RepID=UPI0033D30072